MADDPNIEELIATLKACMEGVAPGPWHTEEGDYKCYDYRFVTDGIHNIADDVDPVEAAYIALCSPDNITALIDAYEAVEAERDELSAVLTIAKKDGLRAVAIAEENQRRAEAAEARVAELTERLNGPASARSRL